MSRPRRLLGILALTAALCGVEIGAVELDGRLKWFGILSLLPEEDLRRQQSGTPGFDQDLDLRLVLRHRTGRFTWLADHSTTYLQSDARGLAGLGPALAQTAVSDRRRLADLTWTLDEGSDRQLLHRFDRLAVRYRHGPWGVTLGRQAVSWGNGLVFQPLDLFNPFAPTTVDQDYKAGDDLLLVERALDAGGNLQLLAVGRRDDAGERGADAASFAGKWHRFIGAGELELVAGRHYRDRVAGVGYRFPVGGALLRADLLATRLATGTWKVSGIVNGDYSFMVGQRNVYAFAEYFHNGFGVRELADSPAAYPEPLTDRLQRGELFNLMRDYLAVGGTLEWHPLWSQDATVIANLHDGSVLLQTQISHEPGDHQRLQLGLVQPLGGAGDEFGGVPAAGDDVTVGGGTRLYLRWAYYF